MSQDFYASGYNMGDAPQQPQQQHYAPQYSSPQASPQYPAPQQPAQYGAPQPQPQYDYNSNSSGYDQQQQNFYTTPGQGQGYPNNYNASPQQDYDNQSFYNNNSYYNPNNSNMGSMGSTPANMGTMGGAPGAANATSDSFEDEPPLMEELGIDLGQIYQTTMTVLNPNKQAATTMMDDPDLSGPLMFCLAFGALLMLSGKLHFGYIYGVGLIGAAAMYTLLNLMSVNGVTASVTVSVLGYCMLPMCVLAAASALLSLKGILGMILCSTTVSWAAFASSKLFVSVLAMYDQQPLVAYPCALMYGVFAVLTVF